MKLQYTTELTLGLIPIYRNGHFYLAVFHAELCRVYIFNSWVSERDNHFIEATA